MVPVRMNDQMAAAKVESASSASPSAPCEPPTTVTVGTSVSK
jgi:hypothetical protein